MREKERSTRVIFVRHGETNYPIDRIYCDDKEDPALSEAGLQQAKSAANSLAKVDVAAIYASPCRRTQMTAAEIASHHPGRVIQTEAALVERNFGIWEGLYFHEIESRYPVEYKEWKTRQAEFKPENGESVFDMADRLRPVLASIVERHAGECVIVVAHVGPIRVMVAEAIGMPVEKYRQLAVDPASITIVDYGKKQNNLILMNFHARHRNISEYENSPKGG